jgi:hypothetical protein
MSRERRQNVSSPLHHSLPPADPDQFYPDIEEAEIVDVANLPANLRETPAPPAPSAVEAAMAEIEADAQQPSAPAAPAPPIDTTPVSEVEEPAPGDDELVPPEDDLAIWEQAVAATDDLEPLDDDGALDEPTAEDLALAAEPTKRLVIRSRRAVLSGPTYLPLLDKSDALHEDAFSHILSDMGSIQPGEYALVNFTMRPAPAYRQQASQWIAATKAGEEVNKTPAALKGLGALGKFIGFFLKLISFTIRRVFHEARGGEEAPRWNRNEQDPQAQTFQLDGPAKDRVKQAENKIKDNNVHMEIALRATAFSTVSEDDVPAVEASLEAIADNMTAGFSSLGTSHQAIAWKRADDEGIDALIARFDGNEDFVLGNTEIANIVHPPDGFTRPHGVKVRRGVTPLYPQIPGPIIPDQVHPPVGVIPMGLIDRYGDSERLVGVPAQLLDQHMLVLGKTGVGKSVWLATLALGLINSGYPLILLDPHGTPKPSKPGLADMLVNYICTYYPNRIDDIVYINLADPLYSPGGNLLDVDGEAAFESATSQTLNMMTQFAFSASQAPRAVMYTDPALKALMSANQYLSPENKLSLLHVSNFFTDPDFRDLVMDFCDIQSVKDMFGPDKGFNKLPEKQQQEHAQAIVRAFQMISNSTGLSRFFATENKMDFGRYISQNKIVICNLGSFGNNAVVGKMVANILFPALLRSMANWGEVLDKDGLPGPRVIVDEAPTVYKGQEDIPSILAECRKFDLGLISAAQFLDQFTSDQKEALTGNTASKVGFKHDARKTCGVEESIAPDGELSKADFARLPRFTMYADYPANEDDTTGPHLLYSPAPLPFADAQTLEAARKRVIENSRREVGVAISVADDRRNGPGFIDRPMDELRVQKMKMTGEQPPPSFTDTDADEFDWGG